MQRHGWVPVSLFASILLILSPAIAQDSCPPDFWKEYTEIQKRAMQAELQLLNCAKDNVTASNLDQALRLLNAVFDKESNPASYYSVLGDIYSNAGKTKEAEAAYLQMLKTPRHRTSTFSHYWVGRFFETKLGDSKRAVEFYRKAIQLYSSDPSSNKDEVCRDTPTKDCLEKMIDRAHGKKLAR